MDPLSVSASVAALTHVAHRLYIYAKGVKEFRKDRMKFLSRIESLNDMVKRLDSLVQRSKQDQNKDVEWYKGLKMLLMPPPPPDHSVPDKPLQGSGKDRTLSDPDHRPPTPGKAPLTGGALYRIYETLVLIAKALEYPGDIERDKGDENAKRQRVPTIFLRLDQRMRWPWHKKKIDAMLSQIVEWQGEAHFILSLDRHDLALDQGIKIDSIKAQGEKQADIYERKARAKARKAVRDWVTTLDFAKRQNDVFGNKCTLTGQRLLKSPEFDMWAKGAPWELTCRAMAGAGKTVLCSLIVDHLVKHRKLPVTYLYLDDKEKDTQTIQPLIGSLLSQLLQQQKTDDEFRSGVVNQLFERCKADRPLSFDEVCEALAAEVSTYERVMVIIDAIDEASPDVQTDLVRHLDELVPGKIQIMTTSRPPESDFGSGKRISCSECGAESLKVYYRCEICPPVLEGKFDLCLECKTKGEHCKDRSHVLKEPYKRVILNVDPTTEEIECYVDWALKREIGKGRSDRDDAITSHLDERTSSLGDRCSEDPDLEERIKSVVVSRADHMFMLARLYMDSLRVKLTVQEVDAALQDFPYGYGDNYNRALQRIDAFKEDPLKANWTYVGKRAVNLVAFAQRPLKFREFQEALAIDLNNPDPEKSVQYSRKTIFDVTAGLLEIQSNDGDVRLVHLTATEHFTKNRSLLFPSSAADIAQILLAYLSRKVFAQPCVGTSEDMDFDVRKRSHPLLSFAYQNWGKYASAAEYVREVHDAVVLFLSSPGRVAATIQAICLLDPDNSAHWDARTGANALHLCAWFGFDGIVQELVQKQFIGIDSREPTFGQTPLMYACRQGHYRTASVLLDLGANVNSISRRKRTALLEAIAKNHADVVQLLLTRSELDLKPPQAGNPEEMALSFACVKGYFQVVDALLKCDRADVDVNQNDNQGNTALILAVHHHHPNVVDKLLQVKNLTINATNDLGNTALTIAAKNNDMVIVRSLIARGASPTVKNREDGGNALTWAVDKGNFEMLQLLLTKDVGVQDSDDEGQTLIHRAANQGNTEICQFLLAKGFDKNSQDDKGRTPLHHASAGDEVAITRCLIRLGANTQLKDEFGRTPGVVAWHNGNKNIMEVLDEMNDERMHASSEEEEQAANSYPNAKDLPIWSLVKLRFKDLALNAIKDRTSIHETDPDNGNNALHYSISTRQIDLIEPLLNAGILPNTRNDISRTPLHVAAIFANDQAAQILITHKATVDAPDKWSQHPLHYFGGHPRRFAVALTLIQYGADTSVLTLQSRQSLFFAAVELNRKDAVETLIDHGVEIWARDPRTGRSALAIAKENGNEELQQVLRANKSIYRTGSQLVGAKADEEWGKQKVVMGFRQPKDIVEKEEVESEECV